MNRVGHEGRGESVWLAWFLYDVLDAQFAALARARDDALCRALLRPGRSAAKHRAPTPGTATGTSARSSTTATPLGAQGNAECQIDSLPQSWAVLSGAGDPARARQAMASVDRAWSAARPASDPAVRPALRPGPSTPATSRATSPASARTAASTPTPRSGRRWPSPMLGDGDRAWELFNLINPVQSRPPPGEIAATGSSPTSSPPMSTRSRRTPAAAAGPGTRAPPAGCTG
jgi:cyclic beta-1,2-glucan synthetase